MESIDESSCLNDELREDSDLSNAVECARTCKLGETKTCYYKFVIERYPINGQACSLCMPNATNTLCPNCQCAPGDGTQRIALTVNRMIPGPSIQVCEGDYIVVDVMNMLKSDSVTIHWHGLFQQGSPYYDGVPHLTQCPIIVQNTFRYQFYANNCGTHFWHAHTSTQKLDGLFGSFIVREPAQNEPYAKLYDYDLANHVIIVNDWLREESTSRLPGRRAGETGRNADTFLINGKGGFIDSDGETTNIPYDVITVDANKRYRFRFINSFCTVCSGQLTVEGHDLTVIAIDGQLIEPVTVDSIVSLAGERYDFVINTNKTPSAYWIQIRGLNSCASILQLAVLQYVGELSTPSTNEPTSTDPLPAGIVSQFLYFMQKSLNVAATNCDVPNADEICASDLKSALPIDPGILKKEPDVKLYLSIGMQSYKPDETFVPNQYQNYLVLSQNKTMITTLNNITSDSPSAPPLSQFDDVAEEEFCSVDNLPSNCTSSEPCTCIHLIKIPLDSIVEINVIDEFNAQSVRHAFHLHGFAFNVIALGQPLGPTSDENPRITLDYFKQLEENDLIEKDLISPPGKDTIPVPNNGYAVLRFRASNAGYWLFHCHQIFHQIAGMEVIFQVGEVRDIPSVPKNFPRCGNYKPAIQVKNKDSKRKINRKQE
ncbi:Laccase-5 [Eufriesea mexicana]|uniref:Laccase-5 n=1 Tax=Eufriesea mexicana TaxID=516756 RepID=A0A310SW68_9HYME|nr:Laccase-5 [Eufriesea mexicana]